MEHAQELMEVLDDMAEALKEEDAQLSRQVLERVRPLLPDACNDEEIAALALIVHQTEHGAIVVQCSELMTLLSRRAAGNPRWNVVLPRLARKGFITLRSDETSMPSCADDIVSAFSDMTFRDTTVTLSIVGHEKGTPVTYECNREYLEDCFMYVETLYEHLLQQYPNARPRRRYTHIDDNDAKYPTDVVSMRRRIERLSAQSACALPLEELRSRERLAERDWQMLLIMLWKELNGERMEVRELLPFFGNRAFGSYDLRKYVCGEGRLFASGIAELGLGPNLMRMDVELDPSIISWLVEGDDENGDGARECNSSDTSEQAEPFACNDEYLEVWLAFVSSMYDSLRQHGRRKRRWEVNRNEVVLEHPVYKEVLSRTMASTAEFPLECMIAKHGFGEIERFIIFTSLLAGLQEHALDIPDALGLLTPSFVGSHKLRVLFEATSPLVKNGFVAVRNTMIGTPDFYMPANMIDRVFQTQEPDTKQMLHVQSELFELREARHTLDAVRLPASEIARLENAVRVLHVEARERLRAWGVNSVTAARPTDSLLLLFSGVPGTGKTFAAEALAGSLGRPLLVTDISKILSKWVGESEQNVAALFREYSEYCSAVDAPPVLLLNECDQFFSQRFSSAGRSVDRMYNQMQSLFLEHLESFPGILIATTNLTDAQDEAFSRRFDEKIRFPRPDTVTRLQLWKMHIPAAIPCSDDVDLARLAEIYHFTGGQIAVAATNSIRIAAVRGDALRMADLIEACEHEVRGSFEKSARIVGFR